MPIIVECSCGKKLKAPEALAGKRAKCSRCGAVVKIPAATAKPADAGLISLAPKDDDGGYALAEDTFAAPSQPARPSPAPVRPSGAVSQNRSSKKQAQGDAPFELTDDLLEPELPVSALVEHNPAPVDAPMRGAGRGKGTHAAMAAAAAKSSMNPTLARADSQYSRGDHNDGPQPWFSLMGIDFTPVKSIVLLAILLLVVGGGTYWFTGPGKGVRIYDARPVTSLIALKSLARHEIKGMAAMARAQAGHAPVKDGPLGSGFMENEEYGLGGPERLIFTRPDPNGDYLFVHVKISQRVVAEEKLESGYDTAFSAGNFIIHAGQQEIKPMLIMGKVIPAELTFHNGNAPIHGIETILPAEPDRYEDAVGPEKSPARATVIFDGSKHITGTVEMQSNRGVFDQPGVQGVIGTGELIQKDPFTGTTLKYDYQGDSMQVSWNGQATAWWSSDQYKRPAAISPFARFDIYLLYPRPQTTDPMILKVNNRVIGTLSPSLASTGAKPSTVAAATVPPGNTPGSTPGSTPGNTASASGNASGGGMPSTPEEAAKAMAGGPGGVGGQGQGKVGTYDYFGALARARQMGMGIVSENNMKQLGMGILQYAQQNQGQLPPDLDHVRMVLGDINQLLLNVRTGANPGFLYIQPATNINHVTNPAATPILYEIRDGQLDRDGAVMYLDGHMEVRK